MDYDKVYVMNCSHPSGHKETVLAALDKGCVVILQGAFPMLTHALLTYRGACAWGKISTMRAWLRA